MSPIAITAILIAFLMVVACYILLFMNHPIP